MGFRDRFKNKKGSLGKQHVTQTQNKDTKGRFPTVIRKDKLPAGVETWQCKEGDHLIDILPFAAGPDFPLDPNTGSPIVSEGDLAYVLDIRVHTNVGSMKIPYVCPYENFGLPCPICEFIKENDLDTEDWKNVSAKRRTFYQIWNHDTRETEKKGIMLWEISHFSMEQNLAAIAALPRGGGAISFSDPDEGKTIAFTRKGSGAKNTQYLGHRFIDREIKLPDKLLDMTFPIDQMVRMHPSYEEIEEAFNGQKGKIGNKDDVENSGSSFAGGGEEDSTPDWMKEDVPGTGDDVPLDPGKKETPTTPKRRVFVRSKK
jgi:hypothetical protein